MRSRVMSGDRRSSRNTSRSPFYSGTGVRKKIQWDFRKTILDAATNQQGDYVVLRVAFAEGQCLACKHQGQQGGVT